MSSNPEMVAGELRFPGLSPAARAFFRALDREPCPSSWPGADRVAYVTHVLGPLKVLVSDLERLLADTRPPVSLEARVGASLAWPRHIAPDSADCPVRTVRAWSASSTRSRAPLLCVTFSGKKIEISLDASADAHATARVREALLGADEDARAEAASLLCAGWQVAGPEEGEEQDAAPDTEDAPEHLKPWFTTPSLRIVRFLAWEPWLEEPGFALEVADRWRELLPVLALMTPPVELPRTSTAAAQDARDS